MYYKTIYFLIYLVVKENENYTDCFIETEYLSVVHFWPYFVMSLFIRRGWLSGVFFTWVVNLPSMGGLVTILHQNSTTKTNVSILILCHKDVLCCCIISVHSRYSIMRWGLHTVRQTLTGQGTIGVKSKQWGGGVRSKQWGVSSDQLGVKGDIRRNNP